MAVEEALFAVFVTIAAYVYACAYFLPNRTCEISIAQRQEKGKCLSTCLWTR